MGIEQMKTSIIFLKIERQIKHTSFRKGANKKKISKSMSMAEIYRTSLYGTIINMNYLFRYFNVSSLKFHVSRRRNSIACIRSVLYSQINQLQQKKKKQKNKKTQKHSYHSQILPQDHSSLYRNHFEEAEIISITNYSKKIY